MTNKAEEKMGIKFGEIDANQILENEYRIKVLEQLVDLLINRSAPGIIKPDDIERIRNDIIEHLQEKYPESGISLSRE